MYRCIEGYERWVDFIEGSHYQLSVIEEDCLLAYREIKRLGHRSASIAERFSFCLIIIELHELQIMLHFLNREGDVFTIAIK